MDRIEKIWSIPNVSLLIMLFAPIIMIGFMFPREQFMILLPLYSISFMSYLILYRRRKLIHPRLVRYSGVFIRVILIFALPSLSDDIYRYLWDADLSIAGINPYIFSPEDFTELGSMEINESLFQDLNSQAYKSVYPPFTQLLFLLGAIFPISSVISRTIVLKGIIILFDIATIILLPKVLKTFHKDPGLAILYTLNPLIILELSGSAHLEGIMLFFLLLSLLLIRNSNYFLAGLSLAVSIASKLIPLMFLPLLFFRIKRNKGFLLLSSVVLISSLLFIPVFFAIHQGGIWESLDLYFRKFEFNGSIYYLTRWISSMIVGYNIIHYTGPVLALAAFILIMFTAITSDKVRSIPFAILISFTIYLLFATTVHPWYLSTLVLFSCFTRFRYPILWSFLAFLSYFNYSQPVFSESMLIVFIEYSILFTFMFYEFFYYKLRNRWET